MLRAAALALACLCLPAQVVQESFARDPGPLDFIRGEGHEQAILQALTGDALVGLDPEGRPVPRLALAWEARGGELCLRLRRDARFLDGTTVRPEDALWTLQELQRRADASPTKRAIVAGLVPRVEAGILVLRAPRPIERLLRELARIPVAKEGRPDLGSGPYALARRGGEWHLQARAHFLAPQVEGFCFRLLEDEGAVLQNLQKGWLTLGVPPARAGLRVPETHVELRQPTHAQVLIWSQLGPEPLRHLEAWRSEALPSSLFGGRARPSEGLWPTTLGFPPRRMAGAPGDARGQRWELLYTAGDALVQRALLALRDRAARSGVDLALRPLEAALLFARLQKGEFQLICALNLFDPHPWSVLELVEPGGPLNVTGWQDPRAPGLLARLDRPGSPAWEALQGLWAERPAALPILDLVGTVWVDRRLEVTPSPLGLYLTTPGPAGWRWRR